MHWASDANAQAYGAQLFALNCAACHQPQGQGVAGAFPKLASGVVVRGDAKTLASLVLHGRGGMPNFSDDLSDPDVAAVLSYVRSAWGNNAPPVPVATVTSARSKGANVHDEPPALSSH